MDSQKLEAILHKLCIATTALLLSQNGLRRNLRATSFKNLLREYPPDPSSLACLHAYACMHAYTSDIHVTPHLKILATDLLTKLIYKICLPGYFKSMKLPLKCICSRSFTDVLMVVNVSWLYSKASHNHCLSSLSATKVTTLLLNNPLLFAVMHAKCGTQIKGLGKAGE